MPSLNYITYTDFNAFDVFVFDLDGTLYDQGTVRRKMLRDILFSLVSFRTTYQDIRIIRSFRKHRESNKGISVPSLEKLQYEWCAREIMIAPTEVKQVINRWMYEYPLQILKDARYPGVEFVFKTLRSRGKKIVVYSDYPVEKKLEALGLFSDRNYCSTDTLIEELKPCQKALKLVCRDFSTEPQKLVYIGDRENTDGESARKTGVRFIRVDPRAARKGIFYNNFLKLESVV